MHGFKSMECVMKRTALVCVLLTIVVAPVRGGAPHPALTTAREAMEAEDLGKMMSALLETVDGAAALKAPAAKIRAARKADAAGELEKAQRLLTEGSALLGTVSPNDLVAVHVAGGLVLYRRDLQRRAMKASWAAETPELVIESPLDLQEKVVEASRAALKAGEHRRVHWLVDRGCNIDVWTKDDTPANWRYEDALLEMRFTALQAGLQAGWSLPGVLGLLERYMEYPESEWGQKDARRQEYIDRIKPVFVDQLRRADAHRSQLAALASLRRDWARLRGAANDPQGQFRHLNAAVEAGDDGIEFEGRLVALGAQIGVEIKEASAAYRHTAELYYEFLHFLRQYLPTLGPEEQLGGAAWYLGANEAAVGAAEGLVRLEPNRCDAWMLQARFVAMEPALVDAAQAKRVAEMIRLLGKVEETGKDVPDCLYDAAAFYGSMGRGAEMKRVLERFLEVAPQDPRVAEAQELVDQIEAQVEGQGQ